MKKLIALTLLLAAILPAMAHDDDIERTPEGLACTFAVFGASASADTLQSICGGEWINMQDLPLTDKPDSYYEGLLLPSTGGFITCHRSVVNKLTPLCVFILIDNKPATREELDAIPTSRLGGVYICRETLYVETHDPGLGNNPYVRAAVNAAAATHFSPQNTTDLLQYLDALKSLKE